MAYEVSDGTLAFVEETVPAVPDLDLEAYENFLVQALSPTEEVIPFSEVSALADDPLDFDDVVILKGTLTTYGNVTLLFPSSAQDVLSISNGSLYNLSASNVVGRMYQGDPVPEQGRYMRIVTVYPELSTSTPTNYYRNGSNISITSYSPGTGQSLSSSVTYVQSTNFEQHNFSLSFWVTCLFLICIVLMAFNALRRILTA